MKDKKLQEIKNRLDWGFEITHEESIYLMNKMEELKSFQSQEFQVKYELSKIKELMLETVERNKHAASDQKKTMYKRLFWKIVAGEYTLPTETPVGVPNPVDSSIDSLGGTYKPLPEPKSLVRTLTY